MNPFQEIQEIQENIDLYLSKETQENIKLIAIRGRMAIALICLENILKKFFVDQEISNLLNLFWDFVEEDANDWDKRRLETEILHSLDDFLYDNEKLPTNSSLNSLPKYVLEIIQAINKIGYYELYGQPQGYSSCTYWFLVKILERTLENSFPIPDIKPFLQWFPFNEPCHNFGKPMSRNIIIQEYTLL